MITVYHEMSYFVINFHRKSPNNIIYQIFKVQNWEMYALESVNNTIFSVEIFYKTKII